LDGLITFAAEHKDYLMIKLKFRQLRIKGRWSRSCGIRC